MLRSILEKCHKNEISVDRALDMIVKGFPKQYTSPYAYKDDLDYLDKVLDLYSLVALDNELTKKERAVLKYYLKFGYSDRVKDSIKKDHTITSQHLNQINFKLTNKGFLEKHPTNNRSKIVSPDLVELRDTFFKQGVRHYTIMFSKR